MAAYKVLLRSSVWHDIENIPKKYLQQIMKRIAALAVNPRPPGCEKLSAQERYRIRQGNYRIICSIQDDELTIGVVKIGHRKDVSLVK